MRGPWGPKALHEPTRDAIIDGIVFSDAAKKERLGSWRI